MLTIQLVVIQHSFVSHSFSRANDLDVQLSASGYVSKKTEKSAEERENDDFEEVWI